MKKISILSGFLFIGFFTYSQLPSTFDLRDYNGNNFVTTVKNQQGGTCWTHGTMASMEGNLYMTGNWSAAGETGEPALAEYHLDWWNGYNDYFNADLDPPLNNGQGLEVHQGGDYRVSTAYISRGDGAVRDIDGQSYSSPPSFFEPSYHKYYPMHVEWYTLGEDFENMNLIKTKVMEEGVMATCMCYSSSFINGEYEHYQPASSYQEPNHSVSIIGWDDDRVVQGAPGNGAWLVKNSWGTSWGNGGYFWISYYDKHACQNPEMGAVSFQEVVAMPYDKVYYHDYHGWRDTLTTADYAFNKFIADANGSISAVSFFTAGDNVDYTFTLFDDFDGNELSNELYSSSGTIEFSGLHTLSLDSPVELSNGEDFYVALQLSHGGIPYDRTSDVPVLLGGGSKTIVTSASNPDESYYWSDTKGWEDFYYYDDPSGFQNSGNFCIKALTQTVYALDMGGIEIQDPTGNNNGQADPGETLNIIVTVVNNGLFDVIDVQGLYSSNDPYLTINSASLDFETLAPGESGDAAFNVTVSSTTPIGHNVEGNILISCMSNGNPFTYQFDLNFKVGLIIEDFESGDFSAFDWSFDGQADWTITSQNPYEGTFSAKSGPIGDQQFSEINIELEVTSDDVIGFYYKVSSEATYDFLRFYIDDLLMDEWEGEVSWSMAEFDISEGTHILSWSYEKDYSVSSGEDCAWIDFVVFPATEQSMPATFDLRNYNGYNYVTSVKSQQGGTCWTHGTMAAIEGNLLMNGVWADQGEEGEPALAEYHLDWWNGFNEYYNADLEPPFNNGQGLEVHQGGDYRVATAYISRGDGAMRDIDGQSFNTPPEYHDTSFHCYYPLDVEWFVLGEDFENMDLIKTQIMANGVLATCMCYSSNFINNQYEHYQPESSTLDPNHSVAIVGWDDNREIAGAPGDGAWLVKNSWGEDWGNDGYFWISYFDKHAGQHPEMGAITFRNTVRYDFNHVFYHDYHGWRDTKTDITEAFNAFTMDATGELEAVSFFTAKHDVNYTLTIYDDFDGTSLSNELISQSGIMSYSGLHTVALNDIISMTEGEDFYVYLELSDGGHPYDRTSEVPVLLCGPETKTIVPSKANPEESYFYDGDNWIDFYYYDDPSGYDNTGNFCIKVLGDLDTGVGINPIKPFDMGSLEVYPNPFSHEVTIRYYLLIQSDVHLSISNIMGVEVHKIEETNQLPGDYTVQWNTGLNEVNGIEPGVYVCRLILNDQVISTRKLIKVK
jgi:C1A family cysteine protease